MPRNIIKIAPAPTLARHKRVAAYARVSSGKDAMLHSLSSQVSYYSKLIQEHEGWQYAGVYSDEALTGTKESRDGFQRLLADCRAGNIDLVLTKSISRFARNTVTLLESVRELKALGVDIYFEEQNIHTLSAEGELMLTILASYAQEESRSASENQKWRVRKNFEEGKPWNGTMLGYRMQDGQYVVVPEEAALVRRIYDEYLSGLGYGAIARGLNEEGVVSRFGGVWHQSVISKILSNYAYTGNLLLQKTYRENHITKRTLTNNGELPKYHAEGSHEAIIDMATFEAVQAEIARRAARFHRGSGDRKQYPFSGLLVCEVCGKHYRRKVTATQPVWICATFNTLGKKYCASKQIPEVMLEAVTAEVTGDLAAVEKIVVAENNTLHFHFKDGSVATRQWKDRSRAEAWTEEKKAEARRKALERRRSDG